MKQKYYITIQQKIKAFFVIFFLISKDIFRVNLWQ